MNECNLYALMLASGNPNVGRTHERLHQTANRDMGEAFSQKAGLQTSGGGGGSCRPDLTRAVDACVLRRNFKEATPRHGPTGTGTPPAQLCLLLAALASESNSDAELVS